MILLSNIRLAMKQKTEKTISLWTFWIMFSRVHWNLLSALNILLYFTYYTKFPFPYCSKVTRESQQKTPIKFKVNECHFVLNCQSTNVFFFRTFFFFFNMSSAISQALTFYISLYLFWDQGKFNKCELSQLYSFFTKCSPTFYFPQT